MKKVIKLTHSCYYSLHCDVTDSFVSFESVAYPGHYLGVMDNGQLRKPVRVESPSSYEFFDIKNAER